MAAKNDLTRLDYEARYAAEQSYLIGLTKSDSSQQLEQVRFRVVWSLVTAIGLIETV